MQSGRVSMGRVAITLAYSTLVITLLVFCGFAVANLQFESPCGPNKAYKEDLLGISPVTGASRIECGLLCFENDDCNSFTYTHGQQSCVISTGLEKNCSLLTSETGSNYYEVVSYAKVT